MFQLSDVWSCFLVCDPSSSIRRNRRHPSINITTTNIHTSKDIIPELDEGYATTSSKHAPLRRQLTTEFVDSCYVPTIAPEMGLCGY